MYTLVCSVNASSSSSKNSINIRPFTVAASSYKLISEPTSLGKVSLFLIIPPTPVDSTMSPMESA